jgi:hypothetical protein
MGWLLNLATLAIGLILLAAGVYIAGPALLASWAGESALSSIWIPTLNSFATFWVWPFFCICIAPGAAITWYSIQALQKRVVHVARSN